MMRWIKSAACIWMLTACGPKYGIPEKTPTWTEQATYEFQVVQKGQISDRGTISNTDIMDLEFKAACKLNGNRHQCDVDGPIAFYGNDATGNRVLRQQEKLAVSIRLDWRGRYLTDIDAPNVSDLFLDVMRNAFGALELAGVPQRCELNYTWNTTDRFQIHKIKGLMGPGSFRNKHSVSGCEERMHIQSQGAVTLSGQATDNMTAERYTFEAVGSTWIDKNSGLIIEKNHRMSLESSSVQSQRGDIIRQVIMKKVK